MNRPQLERAIRIESYSLIEKGFKNKEIASMVGCTYGHIANIRTEMRKATMPCNQMLAETNTQSKA